MDDHLQASGGSAWPVEPAAPPASENMRPQFTGSGSEYFRIWIVNLMLTVATLGIYSAWAKVRRLQYFDRNTSLGGAVFDFRGNPWAILRGRVVALLMFAAYHYGFGFSRGVAFGVVIVLALALPYLLRGAIRFRLQNTYFRGVPFAFTGTVPGAYLVFAPLMLMLIGPAALLALDPSAKSLWMIGVLYLAFPYLYGALKRYQHKHVRFGAADSDYAVSPWRFYRYYLVAFGLALAFSVVFGIGIAVLSPLFKSPTGATGLVGTLIFMSGGLLGYIGFLMLIPYMVARTSNLVWSHTTFPGIHIDCDMSARAYARLQVVNVVLTILTLGLFRPFAVVRTHRYRLAAMTVTAEAGFEAAIAMAGAEGRRDGAAGDGAADFFGFDLSL